MKKQFFKLALPVGMGLALTTITLLFFASLTISSCDTEHCTDKDHPLWCSSAEKCCGPNTPYNDGHGTCWGTLEACRATGYACEHCWEE